MDVSVLLAAGRPKAVRIQTAKKRHLSGECVKLKVNTNDNADVNGARTDRFQHEGPHVPTTIIPLVQGEMVLLKIGDKYLRVGSGNRPSLSKNDISVYPIDEDDRLDCLLSWRQQRPLGNEASLRLNFQYYTFYMDQTATLTESWYRTSTAFFTARFGVIRQDESFKHKRPKRNEYIACCRLYDDKHEVALCPNGSAFGVWWKLIAVGGTERFVCESFNCPGYYLTRGQHGLVVSGPLTRSDKLKISKGVWDDNSLLTILPLPVFADWRPGVTVP